MVNTVYYNFNVSFGANPITRCDVKATHPLGHGNGSLVFLLLFFFFFS